MKIRVEHNDKQWITSSQKKIGFCGKVNIIIDEQIRINDVSIWQRQGIKKGPESLLIEWPREKMDQKMYDAIKASGSDRADIIKLDKNGNVNYIGKFIVEKGKYKLDKNGKRMIQLYPQPKRSYIIDYPTKEFTLAVQKTVYNTIEGYKHLQNFKGETNPSTIKKMVSEVEYFGGLSQNEFDALSDTEKKIKYVPHIDEKKSKTGQFKNMVRLRATVGVQLPVRAQRENGKMPSAEFYIHNLSVYQIADKDDKNKLHWKLVPPGENFAKLDENKKVILNENGLPVNDFDKSIKHSYITFLENEKDQKENIDKKGGGKGNKTTKEIEYKLISKIVETAGLVYKSKDSYFQKQVTGNTMSLSSKTADFLKYKKEFSKLSDKEKSKMLTKKDIHKGDLIITSAGAKGIVKDIIPAKSLHNPMIIVFTNEQNEEKKVKAVGQYVMVKVHDTNAKNKEEIKINENVHDEH